VCGVAVPWHKNLMIANPTIAGRFCDGCVDVEAAYHGLSVEEMHACRARLRVKRIAQDRKYRTSSAARRAGATARRTATGTTSSTASPP
jgi:hypothetical protein